MKNLKYLLSLLAIVLAANSCQKFDELEADPNRSTEVPPSLILRGVLKDMYNDPWSDELRYNQYWASNYNYYDNNEEPAKYKKRSCCNRRRGKTR